MSTQRILSAIFDESVQRFNRAFNQVSSTPNTAPLSGYVHLLDQGQALFITDERQTYLISVELILYFHLKTGDRLEARVAYSPDDNNYIVTDIVTVKHVGYENAPLIKANRSFTLFNQTVNFGTSILVPADDNVSITTKVDQITHELPQDVVPILLSFDGRPTNFNVPTACFTKPNYSNREKLMTCLLTFFQAKQQADIGKDVVLIIDSLDKMFFAFNNCMQSVGTFDPNLFSAAAVTDFENILCTSGKLKVGGSLTIIGLHRTGISPQQLQITDRLHQIMDTIIHE